MGAYQSVCCITSPLEASKEAPGGFEQPDWHLSHIRLCIGQLLAQLNDLLHRPSLWAGQGQSLPNCLFRSQSCQGHLCHILQSVSNLNALNLQANPNVNGLQMACLHQFCTLSIIAMLASIHQSSLLIWWKQHLVKGLCLPRYQGKRFLCCLMFPTPVCPPGLAPHNCQ